MICNSVNERNKSYNNFNNNGSDKDDVNNNDTENNIANVELCYNFKRHQGDHLIQKHDKYLPYTIQFIQQYNTNIFQIKFKTT